jgi:hypothetical protein
MLGPRSLDIRSDRAYDLGRKHGGEKGLEPARVAALAGDRQRRAVFNVQSRARDMGRHHPASTAEYFPSVARHPFGAGNIVGYWFLFRILASRCLSALLNVFLVCCLLLNIVLARDRRWTRRLRWAQFAAGVFGVVTLAAIAIRANAPLIDAAWLTAHGWPPGDKLPYLLSTIGKLNRIARGTLWGFLLVQIGTSAIRVWRLKARGK